MRLFRLLSRVAFIFNVCFLLAAFVLWLPHPPEDNLIASVIPIVYLMAIVINVLLNLSLFILFVVGKLLVARIPAWLLIINFLFFIIQTILLIKTAQQ
jgi:hypothetical protein